MSPTKHRVYLPGLDAAADEIVLEGEAARHPLRVKRLRAGERVDLHNGSGLVASGTVVEAGRGLRIQVISSQMVEPNSPRIEVWSAVPKGPRIGDVVDGLSQVGADFWCPLETVFGGPGVSEGKGERLDRVAAESMKQCGRAWLLEIGGGGTLEEAVRVPVGTMVVIADASGGVYEASSGDRTVRLLVGPEGGWAANELEAALEAGARACCFGPHVMRIETAAVAAAAIVRDASRR